MIVVVYFQIVRLYLYSSALKASSTAFCLCSSLRRFCSRSLCFASLAALSASVCAIFMRTHSLPKDHNTLLLFFFLRSAYSVRHQSVFAQQPSMTLVSVLIDDAPGCQLTHDITRRTRTVRFRLPQRFWQVERATGAAGVGKLSQMNDRMINCGERVEGVVGVVEHDQAVIVVDPAQSESLLKRLQHRLDVPVGDRRR